MKKIIILLICFITLSFPAFAKEPLPAGLTKVPFVSAVNVWSIQIMDQSNMELMAINSTGIHTKPKSIQELEDFDLKKINEQFSNMLKENIQKISYKNIPITTNVDANKPTEKDIANIVLVFGFNYYNPAEKKELLGAVYPRIRYENGGDGALAPVPYYPKDKESLDLALQKLAFEVASALAIK